MAAGRVDVPRRRVFDGLGLKDRGIVVQSNGFGVLDLGRSGFSCRDEGRDVAGFWKASSPSLEDGEIVPSFEDGDCMPPTKKRKCSPVVDAVDSESSDVFSPGGNDDNELCPGDAGEEVGARNLALSRWASDSDDEDLHDSMPLSRNSSPESGEIQRKVLDGDRSRSSLSYERGSSVESARGGEDTELKSENDGLMDVDEKQEKSDVSQMDSADEKGEIEDEPAGASCKSVNMLQCCRSVYEYEYLHAINEGAYGKVFKARDKKTGEVVALKKVKMGSVGARDLEEYGFPISALREINILMSLHHPSIVDLKEVVLDDHDEVFVVMEYMERDLKSLMEGMKYSFNTSEVKCLMLQLLEGVKYLHDNWVIHRDLKTSNILVNNQGELKICDFGMSRQYGSPLKPYTSLVVTLWYRAPELLLGAKQYSTAVDMWSVGCIMAELLAKEPLFKGSKEIDQLDKIFKVLGSPTEKIWPGLSKLPGAKANFPKQPYNLLRKKFPATSFTGTGVLSDLGFDLLNKLLTYDPEKRITVDEALDHPWFSEVPLPKSKEFMPTFPPQYLKRS